MFCLSFFNTAKQQSHGQTGHTPSAKKKTGNKIILDAAFNICVGIFFITRYGKVRG